MPLKSKKFVAYLLAELSWKFLIFWIIFEYKTGIEHYAFMTLVTMIVTSGFIQIGYILGQAALDKYALTATEILDRNDSNKETKD